MMSCGTVVFDRLLAGFARLKMFGTQTKRKKNKNKNTTAREWLNWQSKLTAQVLNSPYLVLYSSSAKDANAVLVKRAEIDCEFIVDHKTYNFPTSDLYEAYYLAAILNSAAPNKMMKDFQSRGLYGARDVHKKILDIYWPLFESNNDLHMNLARLSENAHVKASEFLALDPARQNLTPRHLGRLRLEIKQHLKNELREIDALVETLIGAAA